MVALDLVPLASAIKVKERRDVIVVDLLGAYLSTSLGEDDKALLILKGLLVELMVITTPKVY